MNETLQQLQKVISLGNQLEENCRGMVVQMEGLSKDLKAHNREMARKLDERAGDTSTAK